MADDGFVSLSKQDAGFDLTYLRTGLESFKPDSLSVTILKVFKRSGILSPEHACYFMSSRSRGIGIARDRVGSIV